MTQTNDPTMTQPAKISLAQWADHYTRLRSAGLCEPTYGGPLQRHVEAGDTRLTKLRFDNSAASLHLWNLLLTEEERLHQARARGKTLIGVMKDLGTAAVLAYSVPNVLAFYPDGAWWTPCIMEHNARLLAVADAMGVPEAFCPVRAMLGAFVTGEHFPIPDLLVCSTGAVCDDFSAIAQRVEALGHPITWWEMPCRRVPEKDEPAWMVADDLPAPAEQVQFVEAELHRVWRIMAAAAGHHRADEAWLTEAVRQANVVRGLLAELRESVFSAEPCPLPALEMLIVEMLAIHYCSDPAETEAVLADLLAEVRRRVAAKAGVLPEGAVRVYWVNPVADLRAMNLIEEVGGRICGTDYMVAHALARMDESEPPLRALARAALADPMVGSAAQRADRICREVPRVDAQMVVVSRIPGASHCATEGAIIGAEVRSRLNIPVVEIEVPSLTDALEPGLRTRLEASIETARQRGI